MKKRSYYDGNIYVDVTTGRRYLPKTFCELCGKRINLTVHHFLKQQKCMRDRNSKIKAPYIWDEEFVKENQKLFTLCIFCHSDVELMDDDKFYLEYGVERSVFVYE